MTDKQIIIDGVDVSGCVRLQDDNYSCGLCGVCEGWKTCYYKNWQRAEQKLERIAKICNKFIPDHFKILLIINGGVVEE